MPSGSFDFVQSRLAPSTPLRSVSRPLPSARSPQGGGLPAAEPRRQPHRPRARRAPACSHFRNLSAPSRTHPRCFPAFAPGHPRRAVSAPVARAAPSPRVPSVTVGDPSVGGEIQGKRPGSRAALPSRSGEPQRDPAAGPPLGSRWCRDSPGCPGAAAGSGERRGGGRTALTLVTLPVGWHGSPGRRGETFLVREF